MRNRFRSGCRLVVLLAVAASFALNPVFADAKSKFTSTTDSPRPDQGIQKQTGSGVENSSGRERLTRFVRSNYVWPYGPGPNYSTVTGKQARVPGVLHTIAGGLRLEEFQSSLPSQLQTPNKLGEIDAQYFILEINPDKPGHATIAELNAMGVEVIGPMPINFLVVRIQTGALDGTRSIPDVLDAVPYPAAIKLDPMIGRRPLINADKAVSPVYELAIRLFPGEDVDVVGQKIVALGGELRGAGPALIKARLHRDRLADLAAIEAVMQVQEQLAVLPLGEESSIVMQTGTTSAGRGTIPPYHDEGVNGSGNGVTGTCSVTTATSCTVHTDCPATEFCSTAPQVLLVVDDGAMPDAADLSNTHALAGTPGAAHRKVVSYATAYDYDGRGDFLGCDEGGQGALTHGHAVAATAIGNASNIVDCSTGWDCTVASGPGGGGVPNVQFFHEEDVTNDEWFADGVAPGAKVAVLDANETPASGICPDPAVRPVTAGSNYFDPAAVQTNACPNIDCPGFLQTHYRDYNAKIANFSYGSTNVYSGEAFQIDRFLFLKGDAMTFAAAGNAADDGDNDGRPDLGSVNEPGTNKNGLQIGMTGTDANESRIGGSGIGPARVDNVTAWEVDPQASKDRIQPILMAPGGEAGGNAGILSEYVCRSADNDLVGMVQCDRNDNIPGTSFASPNAAGAGLIVRDYFAQGFYPSGLQKNADRVPNISGALLKAILIASADFVNGPNPPAPGGSVTETYRWNNEQGYGRIQLDNALPLDGWADSATGLIVADGGISGGPINLSGLDGTIDGTVIGETDSETFQVCNPDSELRVALAWMDDVHPTDFGQLNTDLDLELCAPATPACSGKVYYGNYFTDDDNRNRSFTLIPGEAAAEDCPDEDGITGALDSSEWSLPICTRTSPITTSPHDQANPTEGIFLTNDLDGDNDLDINPDANPSDDTQVVAGEWTVKVIAGTGSSAAPNATQRYAVAIAGAGCIGSSVRFDEGSYTCNVESTVTVAEFLDVSDPVTEALVSTRTKIEVLSGGSVVDIESGLNFTKDADPESLRFKADPLLLTDAAARALESGVLEVRDGDLLRVSYRDSDGVRTSESKVNCDMRIAAGAITLGQFGFDRPIAIQGGCEKNARNMFEFGFPDNYLDENENIILSYTFASTETEEIEQIEASLRCVEADDAKAPKTCRPGTQPSASCPNPDRLLSGTGADMIACASSWLTITNSPIVIPSLPSGSAIALNFAITMGAVIPDEKEVEFVLELTAPTAGLSGISRAVIRQFLDTDEVQTLYSTDFPTGGREFADWNNNEQLEGCLDGDGAAGLGCTQTSQPTTTLAFFNQDYRFEERIFSDATATGKNLSISAPWDFNTNNGMMRNGIGAPADDDAITNTISQWGEDKNFNNLLDGFCESRYCSGDTSKACVTNGDCATFGNQCLTQQPLGYCGGNPNGTLCADIDDLDADLIAEDCEGNIDGQNCALITCNSAGDCLAPGVFPTNPAPNNFVALCRSQSEDVDEFQSFALEEAWSTVGGCGWQTGLAGTCNGAGGPCFKDIDCTFPDTCTAGTPPQRGMWHTGRVGPLTDPACLGIGNDLNQCQGIEVVGGDTGERTWFELLVAPELEKVDAMADEVNVNYFGWNQSLDLADSNAALSWEFDGDLDSVVPVDLKSDGAVMGIAFGGFTPRGGTLMEAQNNPDLTNGFSLFAPVLDDGKYTPYNGFEPTGGNRVGHNACYFIGAGVLTSESQNELGLAGPLDDDVNNGSCPQDLHLACSGRCVGGGATQDGKVCQVSDNGTGTFAQEAYDNDCLPQFGAAGVCTFDAVSNACDETLICNGSNRCEDINTNVVNDTFVCATNSDCYTCQFSNALIDEYVFPNGPLRNMDFTAFNGADGRFTTVEDVQGETKDRFQLALGMINFEKADDMEPDPATSYGVGLDDLVVEWREITRQPDATDCGTGFAACAALDSSVGSSYDGITFLDVTLLETSPSPNDCNDDGDNTDTGDTIDCGTGTAVARITARSENEPAGERINLECVTPPAATATTCPSGEYRGSVPVSATYDSPGVVFVQRQGVDNPIVELRYFDYDDGTGSQCMNNIDANFNGLVQAFTVVSLSSGNVALTRVELVDNGDADAWADSNETIDMRITLRNQTGVDLSNVTARLATSDARIDCIIDAESYFGDMEADNPQTPFDEGSKRATTDVFTFKIANVQRTGFCTETPATSCDDDTDCTGGTNVCDAQLRNFTGLMNLFISADQFDTAFVVQNVELDLDIDATGGGVPDAVTETFDVLTPGGTDFGIFEVQNLDATPGLGGNGGSLAASDGFRCSFADPADPASFTAGDTDCYMGIDATHADAVWWNITDNRSVSGSNSVAFNTPGLADDDPAGRFTTPTGVMEAIATTDPVPLGYQPVCSNAPTVLCDLVTGVPCVSPGECIPAFPRVEWLHQISLIDFRTVNASSAIRSADGGVVHVQLSDDTGTPTGSWIKVETVSNQYDSQREDNYNICSFDPVDDGHDEDFGFDGGGLGAPIFGYCDNDGTTVCNANVDCTSLNCVATGTFRDGAGRKIGPSSTCFPEFAFTYMGDTDTPFEENNVGNATELPGLPGTGLGTWVKSVVDLSRFRGQQVRVRMLVSSLKIDTTWEGAFGVDDPIPGDDGWWIDDFAVLDTIDDPATLTADIKDNSGLADCGDVCNTVTASLAKDPTTTLSSPGQVVELSAVASMANRCTDGVLQFRFRQTVPTASVLRDWTENPILLAAPTAASNTYAVDVRCSTLTTCSATAFIPIAVDCPTAAAMSMPMLVADPVTKGRFDWAGPGPWWFGEGNIGTWGTTYPTTSTGFHPAGIGTHFMTGTDKWLLVRENVANNESGFCNTGGVGLYNAGGAPQRDAPAATGLP